MVLYCYYKILRLLNNLDFRCTLTLLNLSLHAMCVNVYFVHFVIMCTTSLKAIKAWLIAINICITYTGVLCCMIAYHYSVMPESLIEMYLMFQCKEKLTR